MKAPNRHCQFKCDVFVLNVVSYSYVLMSTPNKLHQRKTNSEAASWLITYHPNDGCRFITKRSWNKKEHTLLADHYLQSIPHASNHCYSALLSIMSVPTFYKSLQKHLPVSKTDEELLGYYIVRELNLASKTEIDNDIVTNFINSLNT